MAQKTKSKELEKVNTGLELEARTGLIEQLNALLADEHVLYTKTRNYHWNVTGLHFASLHALFEEQYNTLKLRADAIAEQVRMLGGYPIGTLQEFLDVTRLAETPGEVLDAPQMIANLLDDHEQIMRALRDDIEAAMEEFGDEGTGDLLVGILRDHDEMAWMLRASLQ